VTIGNDGQKPRLPIFGQAALFFFGFALFAGDAAAQVLEFPAGPPAGELQCPPHKHHGRHKHAKRAGEALEPPANEELAALSVQDEGQPQQIILNGRGQPETSRPFSIALWGDSLTAANYFSEEMVRDLGFSKDEVLPTFIPPDMDRSGVRLPIHKHCQGEGWSYEYAYVSRQTDVSFAKGLVNLRSHVPGSYLWVDFRTHSPEPNLRALDVLFAPPQANKRVVVGFTVDDGAEQIVELEQGGDGLVRVRSEQPMSTLKLRLIEGSLVLQGFVPQYVQTPAAYFDTLSIPGATAHAWKALNPDYLAQRGGNIAYDMVILEYGTNEGNDRGLDFNKYESDLRVSLHNLRQAYPGSLCVLIGPPDRGVLVKRGRGRKKRRAKPSKANLLKYSHIHQRIGDIQRAVGEEYSCSYWSWQDAMGGPGSAYRWLHHSPPLIGSDITHLTVPGYQISARKFVSDTGLRKYLGMRAD